MKEYTIIVQYGSGKPFQLYTYNSFESCYCALLSIINTNRSKKEYYVINDFYKNEYTPFLKDITKYTIKVRDVTEWEIYSNNMKKIQSQEKIINLFN